MYIASAKWTNLNRINSIQTVSWFERSATFSEEDQQYLTYMCYVSVFPMRLYPLPRGEERVIQRLPQIYPWRNEWGRPGDIALLAIDTITQKRIGAAWCRLFPDANDFVPGFYDRNIPVVSIAVDAYSRHRGIGGSLLRSLKQTAYQQGYAALSLAVTAKNPVKFLYEKHGFKAQNVPNYPGLITMTADLGGKIDNRYRNPIC